MDMQMLILSSESENDLNLIQQLARKMGLKSRLLSKEERENYVLLAAMLEADRDDKVSKESVFELPDAKYR
ncbi:MAG: hypothetical protein ACOCX8_01070 [Bacteroidota bacterium]